MLNVSWRPRAHLDRESIAIYWGLERGKPDVALNILERIDTALLFICEFPDSGGHCQIEKLAHNEYRTALANPYTIYYRYDDTTLTIYRVLHQRQNFDTYSLIDLEQ